MITRLKNEISAESEAEKSKTEELNMIRHASDESEFENRMSTYEEEDAYNATHGKQGVFI